MTEKSPPRVAGGQTQRVAGAARGAALHEQLFRYAQDIQVLMEHIGDLETRYKEMAESYRQFREMHEASENLFVQLSHDIHLTTSATGIIRQCNAAAGLIAPPPALVGLPLRGLVLPSHRIEFDRLLENVLGMTEFHPADQELWLRRDDIDGGRLIMAAKALPMLEDGEVESVRWILRDLTQERELAFDAQLSSMMFRSMADGVMITDLDREILAVNPAFSRITGYEAVEVIGRSPNILKSGVQDASFYEHLWTVLLDCGQWQGEIFNRKKNGDIYPEWLTVTVARDNAGQALAYVGVFSDLSRLKDAEKRLEFAANHDSLTDLPNRSLLLDRLGIAIAQARRGGYPLTVLFIDLDRFKPINDQLGHEAGDLVLKEVARRLKSLVRDSDTVGRLGGDEFVIVASGFAVGRAAERFAEKIIDALTRPIDSFGPCAVVGCSIGIAQYEEGLDTESLLRNADVAMYRAKKEGGGKCRMYCSKNEGGEMQAHPAEPE